MRNQTPLRTTACSVPPCSRCHVGHIRGGTSSAQFAGFFLPGARPHQGSGALLKKAKVKTFAVGSRVGEVPESPAPQFDAEVQISAKAVGYKERRKMFRQLPYGHVPGIVPICRDSNDQATQVDALKRRLCRQLPPIDPTELDAFKAYVFKWCASHLSPLGSYELMGFEEWLDSTTYSGARKLALTQVYNDMHGKIPSRSIASRVKAFIKSESYPAAAFWKAARWICSRTDESKVILGPLFKSIEKKVYEDPHFVKHTPVSMRPARVAELRRSGCTYIVTDYTSFEASFSTEVMHACEVAMYQFMLSNFPKYSEFVRRTLCGQNNISTRRGVKVSLKGRRMSGDMCTSLGNGFTNLMLMGYVMEKLGSKWDGLVEGDDGIFAVSGPVPATEDFAKLGFDIKLGKVDDPSLAGFCGVVAADSGLIRDPIRFLQTFGWTTTAVYGSSKVGMELLRAKSLSALYETPACPILSAIAHRSYSITQGFEPRFPEDGYHVKPLDLVVADPAPISDATRDLFSTLYGVLPEDQVKLEKMIEVELNLDFLAPFLNPHSSMDRARSWFVEDE